MKRVLVLMTLGALCFAGMLLAARGASGVTASLQLAASDLLFLRPGGPRLGRVPARQDIVLVLFDMKSAQQTGVVHRYELDVQLYRALFQAQAKAVFDTRMIASATAEDFQTIQPLLDGMAALRDDSALLRDFWLSSELLAEHHPRYERMMAQNTPNFHPHAQGSLRSRLYPLIHISSLGPRESAPLQIARRVWGLEKADPQSVGTAMRESGIMSAWHTQAPDLVPKSEIPRRPYPLGERSIVWHVFPSTSALVPPAGFWVSYASLASEYRRFSYVDAMNHAAATDFAGKIVIVGFSLDTDPSSDTYEIPSSTGKATAAEVAASAVQTLLDGRRMREVPLAVSLGAAALMTIGLTVLSGVLRPLGGMLATLAALTTFFVAATVAYRADWYVDCVLAPSAGIIGAVLGGSYGSWLNLRARQRVVDLFGRYVPRAVVSQLILKPELEALQLGGVRREVSVLFADIRGFTTFSQDLSPEEVLRQLNAILQIMVECTFANEGTLDKFIGDAILVLFNAPLDQPDHVSRAVRTAAQIQERLAGHPTGLAVGVGVHRGDAVVGNIGAAQRMEYTAIGNTVNIASRLCGTAKAGQIVVSKTVADSLDGQFELEPLPPVQVKGISLPLDVSLIKGPRPARQA